jgi:hypothetical protein
MVAAAVAVVAAIATKLVQSIRSNIVAPAIIAGALFLVARVDCDPIQRRAAA